MKEYTFQLISTGIVILLTFIVRYIIRKLIKRYGKLHPRIEHRIPHTNRIVSNLINVTAIIVLVGVWGVNTENLFIALSSLFAIIGVALFAQWSLLSNITAGLLIFFSSIFKIGDRIRVEDKDLPIEGIVEDIRTFNTIIRTDDGRKHIYPNSLFMQKSISRTS